MATSKKSQSKVEKVMHEYNEGTLNSSGGDKVNSRKQSIANGISEAKSAGEKIAVTKKRK